MTNALSAWHRPDVRNRNKIQQMAILVSLFAGDSEAICRCLDSGGWPPELPVSECAEEVGFKFGIMPEQAFDARPCWQGARADRSPYSTRHSP